MRAHVVKRGRRLGSTAARVGVRSSATHLDRFLELFAVFHATQHLPRFVRLWFSSKVSIGNLPGNWS